MSDQQGRDLLEMDSRMFSAKGAIDSLNQEIAEFFYPERADFTSEITLGEEFASHLTDFYPVLVRRELGDQIGAMTRPSDREWFKSSVDNKDVERDQAAREYLEFMTRVNRSILYSKDSGFRRAWKEADHDWSAFGWSVKLVAYNKQRDNLLCSTFHLRDCAIAEGPDKRVDHLHRKADMNAMSLAHWFGEDKLPQAAKECLKQKDYKRTFKVRHIFIPLTKYDPYRKFPKWAKWADIYVTEDGTILQEIPSATFDYVVSRWQTLSGKCYPVSPATITALPQARMIQRMMMTLIEAGEKQVDPPMIATEDAVTSPIDIMAGGITYIDSEYDERLGQALRPIDLGKNVGLGENLLDDARSLLADAFFINKLTPLASAQREKTAYETAQLVQEYVRNALPLFEPVESEDSGVLLDLVTQKVMRAGGYGQVDRNGIPVDMPDSLLGREITVEFNSALREARDRQRITAFQEGMQLIGMAAQADPATLSEVNLRDMFRDSFGAVPGGSADWLNDADAALQGRQKMAEAQQQAAEQEEVSQGVDIAKRGGEAAQAIMGAMNG